MNEFKLSDDALIQLLEAFGHDVPREHIDEVAGRDGRMEAKLIAIIDDESTWLCEPGDWSRWLPVHAVMALGLRSSEAAGFGIVRALHLSARHQFEEFDWVSPYWVALLRNKPESVHDSFRPLLNDRSTPTYIRIVSAEVLTAAAQRTGAQQLRAHLDHLARIVTDPPETLEFRQQIAAQLLDFPRPEYRSILESIAGLESSCGVMYTLSEVEGAYAVGRDTPEWQTFTDPWAFYSEDAIALRYVAEMKDLEHVAYGESVAMFSSKVGRNDPCPCGSGRKYTRCCVGAPCIDATFH